MWKTVKRKAKNEPKLRPQAGGGKVAKPPKRMQPSGARQTHLPIAGAQDKYSWLLSRTASTREKPLTNLRARSHVHYAKHHFHFDGEVADGFDLNDVPTSEPVEGEMTNGSQASPNDTQGTQPQKFYRVNISLP